MFVLGSACICEPKISREGIRELLLVHWYSFQTLCIHVLINADRQILFLLDVDGNVCKGCKGFIIFCSHMKDGLKFVDDYVD